MKRSAVLYFTRNPQCEGMQKKIFSKTGKKTNNVVSKTLFRNTLATIKKSGLPFFIVDSAQQIGNSFGERLANAIEEVFKKGYDQVIAVGNDAPLLSSTHLRRAASAAESGSIVLGPDRRGGIYLISVSKDAFLKKDFINFSWKTKLLFNSIDEWTSKKGFTKVILSSLSDINHEWDIRSLIFQKKISLSLFHFLISIIAPVIECCKNESLKVPRTFSQTALSWRGPPSC